MPDDKVAVVTGGTRGIGLAITSALLLSGARVFAGSVNTVHGDKVATTSKLAGGLTQEQLGRLSLLPLDVRCDASVAAFVEAVNAQAGMISILVNSAGVSHHQTVVDHDDREWQKVLDVNLSGTYRMIKACLPDMQQSRWGRIVNIASTAAHTAQPGYAAYCASKAGVLGLTRTVALEAAAFGINCVSVSPTWVATDMIHATASEIAAERGATKQQVLDEIASSNPQQRIVEPDEIASLVNFLCSDACSGLTLEDIQVNAGAHW